MRRTARWRGCAGLACLLLPRTDSGYGALLPALLGLGVGMGLLAVAVTVGTVPSRPRVAAG